LQVSPYGHPAGALLNKGHTPLLLLPLTVGMRVDSDLDTIGWLPVCMIPAGDGGTMSRGSLLDWSSEYENRFNGFCAPHAVEPITHN